MKTKRPVCATVFAAGDRVTFDINRLGYLTGSAIVAEYHRWFYRLVNIVVTRGRSEMHENYQGELWAAGYELECAEEERR